VTGREGSDFHELAGAILSCVPAGKSTRAIKSGAVVSLWVLPPAPHTAASPLLLLLLLQVLLLVLLQVLLLLLLLRALRGECRGGAGAGWGAGRGPEELVALGQAEVPQGHQALPAAHDEGRCGARLEGGRNARALLQVSPAGRRRKGEEGKIK